MKLKTKRLLEEYLNQRNCFIDDNFPSALKERMDEIKKQENITSIKGTRVEHEFIEIRRNLAKQFDELNGLNFEEGIG